MLAKMKKADTECTTSVAKAYTAAAKQIAGEALPMLIWIPLGRRAAKAASDINRDFWRARVEVANAKSKRAIAGVAGKTVGVCIVTLALSLLIHAWLRSRSLSSDSPWWKGPGGALAVLIVVLVVVIIWLLRSGYQISELLPNPDVWSHDGTDAAASAAGTAGDQVQWL